MNRIALFLGLLALSIALAADAAEQSVGSDLTAVVDKHLAQTLNDPLSAINYRVSSRVNCKDALAEIEYASADCVCYAVNAKNRFGGYVGDKFFAAQFVLADGGLRLMPPIEILEQRGVAACEAGDLRSRSPEKITQHLAHH
jgi:hypothetical protein